MIMLDIEATPTTAPKARRKPRKTTKKDRMPAVKVSHVELICWSIQHITDQLTKQKKDAEQAHKFGAVDLEAGLKKEADQLKDILAVLRQMYKTETGTKFGE